MPAGLSIRIENSKIEKTEQSQQPHSGKSTFPNILDSRSQVNNDQKGFNSDSITQSAPRFQQNNQNIDVFLKNINQIKGSVSLNNKNNKEQQIVISKNSLSSLPETNNNNIDGQQSRQRYGSEGGAGAITNIPRSIFIDKIQNFQYDKDQQLQFINKESNLIIKSNENFEMNQNISPCFISSPSGKNKSSSLISKKKKKEKSETHKKTQSNENSQETLSNNEDNDINKNILCQNELPQDLNNYKNSSIIQLVAPNITIINNDFSQINNFSQQQMQQIMKNENKQGKQKKKKKSMNQDGLADFGVYETFNTNINSDFSKSNLKKIVSNNKEEINIQNKMSGKTGNPKKRNKTNEVKSNNLQQKGKKSQKNVTSKELIHQIYSTNYLQNLQYAQIYSNNQVSDKPYINNHLVKNLQKDDSNKHS